MGNSPNRFEVVDWAVNRQFSKEHNISAWQELEPKNWEYYTGERFTHISRSHYPSYTKGWIYGYNEDADYWKDLMYTYSEEDSP